MKYRKTALIEAERFDGSDEMIKKYDLRYNREASLYEDREIGWVISTVEGDIEVHINDWIATGVNGEHWAIADDVFKKTYEAVKADKKCRYCRPNHETSITDLTNTDLNITIDTDDPVTPMIGAECNCGCCEYSYSYLINYCPMCGRKLNA